MASYNLMFSHKKQGIHSVISTHYDAGIVNFAYITNITNNNGEHIGHKWSYNTGTNELVIFGDTTYIVVYIDRNLKLRRIKMDKILKRNDNTDSKRSHKEV